MTNYKLYNGMNDYLQQEGQRTGRRADKPYNAYLIMKELEERNTAHSAMIGDTMLIELTYEDENDKELLTVRHYLNKERQAIRQFTGISSLSTNKLFRKVGINEHPNTIEEAEEAIKTIRTILETITILEGDI